MVEIMLRGVGRSQILGGPSAFMRALLTDDSPPEALAILSNLWVKSWNFIPFSLQTGYLKEYQL